MRVRIALTCIAFWQLLGIQIVGAQTYRATLLDHPDGTFDVFAINDAGQIVGNVEIDPNNFHAVRREPNGQFTDLPELGGNLSRAFGMNELGDACGFTVDANGGGHTGVWENGIFRELDLPGGAAFAPFALDLNNQGVTTGYFFNANNIPHAVVWDADGNVQNLPELDGFASIANAINEAGEIAGQITRTGDSSAVLWRPNNNGGYDAIDLGTLGGVRAGANDVNNNSEVVGFSFLDETSGITHAFVWEDGQMTDLGTLGGDNSIAAAINDRGDIVGSSQVSSSTSVQGAVFPGSFWRTVKYGPKFQSLARYGS